MTMLGGVKENLGINSALTPLCTRVNVVNVVYYQSVIEVALANTEPQLKLPK